MSRKGRHKTRKHRPTPPVAPPDGRTHSALDQPPAPFVRLARWIPEAGFFVVYFVYTWRVVDPSLEYHHQAPMFIFDWTSFHHAASRSGGLLEYIGAGIAQFYVIGWLGAVLGTGMTWLICRFTRRLLRCLQSARTTGQHPQPGRDGFHPVPDSGRGGTRPYRRPEGLSEVRSAHLLPAMLLLAAQTDYGFPIVQVSLGLCLSLGAAVLERQLEPRHPGGRWTLFALILILLYWVAGGFYLVFAGISLAIETGRHWAPWLERVTRPRSFQGLRNHAVVLIGGAIAVYAGIMFNRQQKLLIQIDTLARQRQWSQVIDRAGDLEETTTAAAMDISRALFHLGRLPTDQFSRALPQPLILLPLTNEQLRSGGLALVDTLIELGHVNHAEHWAYETLELEGEQPLTLERLAQIHELKGQPEAAQIYRNLIDKNPVLGWLAERSVLHSPTAPWRRAAAGPDAYESLRVREDTPSSHVQVDSLLLQLLRTNIRNRMAFEYLMGYYLQTRQLEKAVQLLGEIDKLDYPEIPATYQEALVLFRALPPSPQPVGESLSLARDLPQRFADFLSALRPLEQAPASARLALEPQWGNTYWFYYFLSDHGPSPSISATESYH